MDKRQRPKTPKVAQATTRRAPAGLQWHPMNTPALTCFSLSITDHVAHLVLNKPEAMNTMHPTFWRELDAVLAQLHQAGEARALVLSLIHI